MRCEVHTTANQRVTGLCNYTRRDVLRRGVKNVAEFKYVNLGRGSLPVMVTDCRGRHISIRQSGLWHLRASHLLVSAHRVVCGPPATLAVLLENILRS